VVATKLSERRERSRHHRAGTYDLGFRDYNPGLNRFLTRDQYNGALADQNLTTNPYSGNRYNLAAGNPINRIEIDGHMAIEEDAVGTDPEVFAGMVAADISSQRGHFHDH
jgi:RHS repeat-associated protein